MATENADIVEQEELPPGARNGRVADAGGLQIGPRPFRRSRAVAGHNISPVSGS